MKNNFEIDGLQLLSKKEAIQIDAGGFAYDVGRCIRFICINAFYGTPAAIVDYLENELKNAQA